MRTHPAKRQCKNAPYHLSRFRVDDKLSLGVRGFAVPIQCKGADEQPLSAFVVQHGADIVGQVLQIPLVDQPIDLAGFFVCRLAGIHMVHHGNKPDAPFDELSVQIFFHQLHITGKAGLRLCQHHIKLMFAGSLDHGIECRALPVDAGIILVRIDPVNFKALFCGIRGQHGLLVLDALRFTVFPFILLAQAAVNCRFHGLRPLFSAQVSLHSILIALPSTLRPARVWAYSFAVHP